MIEYVCVCVTVSKERCTGIPLSPSDGRISKIIQGYERNLRSSTRLSTMKMIRGGGWMLDDDTIDDHFRNYHTNRCSQGCKKPNFSKPFRLGFLKNLKMP